MNNSRAQKNAARFQVFISVFLVLMMVMTSGCEPLRKKFTRKKKKDRRATEFIPVLDPIDYPDKIETPEIVYRHHYSLWQVWHRDLVTVLEEKGSDKRILYFLEQILVHLEEMKKVLTGEPHKLLAQYIAKMRKVQGTMRQPASIRNNDGMKRKIGLIGKQVRKNLRFQRVEESLVK